MGTLGWSGDLSVAVTTMVIGSLTSLGEVCPAGPDLRDPPGGSIGCGTAQPLP